MKKLLLMLTLIMTLSLEGHEGHEEPGAIPPAPHGGVVAEAKHMHEHSQKGHNHKDAKKREIFFEGVYKGKTLKIFPLELDPKTYKSFLDSDISLYKDVKIKLIDPRKKKTYTPKFKIFKNHWNVSLEKVKGRRFIVKIESSLFGANYKTELQVERK